MWFCAEHPLAPRPYISSGTVFAFSSLFFSVGRNLSRFQPTLFLSRALFPAFNTLESNIHNVLLSSLKINCLCMGSQMFPVRFLPVCGHIETAHCLFIEFRCSARLELRMHAYATVPLELYSAYMHNRAADACFWYKPISLFLILTPNYSTLMLVSMIPSLGWNVPKWPRFSPFGHPSCTSVASKPSCYAISN